MSSDTNDQGENICKHQELENCNCGIFADMEPVDLDSDDFTKTDDFVYVGVKVPPQYKFYLQKVADSFADPNGETSYPHPGNRSDVLENFIKFGLRRVKESSERGSLWQSLTHRFDGKEEKQRMIEELEEEKSELEEELKDEKRRRKELQKEVKRLKSQHNIVESHADIRLHILDILGDEMLSIEEISDQLKQRGIEERQEHPMDDEEISLKRFVNILMNTQISAMPNIEEEEQNGATVYGKTS